MTTAKLPHTRTGPALYAPTIFLSAFLLFLVQPLIARILLPWFGGSAAVWTTCLMFFQSALLLGYLYAYWSTSRLSPRAQAKLHIAVLCLSLLALPILPSARWKPAGSAHPVVDILFLLAVAVGLPYLLLSTTGPLLQAWYARSIGAAMPYRLYALSNAGSLLALLSYPLLVEPALGLVRQAYSWSLVYGVFVLLCGAVALPLARAPQTLNPPTLTDPAVPRPRVSEQTLWVGLAAVPSALLLAVTTHLSQNIAPIPLLWVVPLGLYLLSLILCFDSDRWYSRPVWLRIWLVAAGAMTYGLFPENSNTSIKVMLPVFLAGLFCCCMVCHGELSRRKPPARWLTFFYLMLSLGGAIGGILVAIVAPALLRSYLELPLALLACIVLGVWSAWRAGYVRFGTSDGPSIVLASLAIVVALAYRSTVVERRWLHEHRLVARDFYGVSRVKDDKEEPIIRNLYHGTINHGAEFIDPEFRREPLSYYGPRSGVARAIADREAGGPVKIGVVGLGAGTLAAYGRPGDAVEFYELNPLVETIARSQFWYLSDSPARLNVVLGDARRSLESQPPQQFDVLAIDAFSSDAIPVHLLTVEAFREYFRHLKPGGIVAVHISNRYLDLEWVVRLAAQALAKRALAVIDLQSEGQSDGMSNSDWVLVSSEPDAFREPKWKGLGSIGPRPPHLRLWTDDYSNLLAIVK